MMQPAGLAGELFKLAIEPDRVTLQRGHVGVGVQGVEAARRVPGRTGGQLGALDEHDIAPAEPGEVVKHAAPDHPAPDHRDLHIGFHGFASIGALVRGSNQHERLARSRSSVRARSNRACPATDRSSTLAPRWPAPAGPDDQGGRPDPEVSIFTRGAGRAFLDPDICGGRMRIASWNVNGLRACAGKGFLDVLARSKAHVMGLQEVRAFEEQLPDAVRSPKGWRTHFAPAQRPGYSGVGLYSRAAPDRVEDSLGEPRFDVEGRYQLARFGKVVVVNAYFPKGSGKERDNSRVPYKLDFYRAVFDRVQRLRRRYRVFVMGDWNTAHNEIDLARPGGNRKSSGFLPEERAEMDRWLAAGWVDTFRKLNPDAAGHYTWWRQWGGAREKNVGWRIDYILASPGAMRRVRDAFIWPHMTGSDHCPVGVDIED